MQEAKFEGPGRTVKLNCRSLGGSEEKGGGRRLAEGACAVTEHAGCKRVASGDGEAAAGA